MYYFLRLIVLYDIIAIGSILFDMRLGCLRESIPKRTQQFIDSIEEMMSTSLLVMVGESIHRRLNTPYWKRHHNAWSTMFDICKYLHAIWRLE